MILHWVICLSLCLATRDDLPHDIDGRRTFAEFLFQQGRFVEASVEFQRLAWYSRDSGDRAGWCNAITMARECLSATRDYAGVIRLNGALLLSADTCNSCETRLSTARALLGMGSFSAAIETLDVALASPGCLKRSLNDAAYYRIVAFLNLNELDSAQVVIHEYRASVGTDLRLETAWSTYEVLRSIKHVSPPVATALSVIPGGGYWYSGYRQTAIYSLVTVAALTLAASSAYRSGQDGFGGFIAGLTLVWYVGSAYGGHASARQRNDWEVARGLAGLTY